jgi:hypothetical protein
MANTKISALTSATTPLAGTEVLPIVQSSATVKVAVSDLTAGRSISVSGLTNTGLTASKPVFTDASKLLTSTGVVPVANGGTNASAASITAFNNITGYTASGATGTTSTNLVFSTSPSITTPTLVGDVTVSTGNVVIGTSGKGIDFSVTSSGTGTMTSELFADYEEGTWTPTLIGDSTNPTVTYGLQRGIYTKVGRVVTVSVFMTWTAKSGGSGNIGFGNLPFTIENAVGTSFAGSISLFDGFTLSVGRTSVGLLGAGGTTYSLPTCVGSAVSSQYITVGSVAASGTAQYTLTYSV